ADGDRAVLRVGLGVRQVAVAGDLEPVGGLLPGVEAGHLGGLEQRPRAVGAVVAPDEQLAAVLADQHLVLAEVVLVVVLRGVVAEAEHAGLRVLRAALPAQVDAHAQVDRALSAVGGPGLHRRLVLGGADGELLVDVAVLAAVLELGAVLVGPPGGAAVEVLLVDHIGLGGERRVGGQVERDRADQHQGQPRGAADEQRAPAGPLLPAGGTRRDRSGRDPGAARTAGAGAEPPGLTVRRRGLPRAEARLRAGQRGRGAVPGLPAGGPRPA